MTGQPITGWTIQATCPHDGHQLTHVADGRPDEHSARAIAECTGCGRQLAVQITLTDASTVLGRKRTIPHRADCTCPPCGWARRKETAA